MWSVDAALLTLLVAAAAARHAAGALYAPAVSSRVTLIPTWLPDLLGSEPGPARRCVWQEHQMPPAINIDLKVSFELYDMEPGAKGRKFIRDLLIHGGHADTRGFSYADAFLRNDEGAIVGPAFVAGGIGPGGAAPGAVAYPGAAAARADAVRFRRARVKNGFEFITRHLSDGPRSRWS